LQFPSCATRHPLTVCLLRIPRNFEAGVYVMNAFHT
jgi:hypothetical protein